MTLDRMGKINHSASADETVRPSRDHNNNSGAPGISRSAESRAEQSGAGSSLESGENQAQALLPLQRTKGFCPPAARA